MCSYIDMTNTPEGGFIAKEDILCYKTMRKRTVGEGFFLYSIYYGKVYDVGKTYDNKLEVGDWLYKVWRREGENAYWTHYLMRERFDERRYESDGNIVGKPVDTGVRITKEGLYSYTHYMNGSMRKEMAGSLGEGAFRLFAVRCRIPKGSRYYVSDDGETYVSDNITIDAVIDAA